ncbi:MAG: ABC transporter permease [Zetaproteobacteria bacterium]|nr:ABC transporter permease [Zetaproteobacteria bacterium]
MKLQRLAWRNLSRNPRRTWITLVSIAFGVLLSVTFTGMGDYFYTNMVNTGAKMGMGHVTVEPQGYSQNPTLAKYLNPDDAIYQSLRALDGVAGVSQTIMGQAMFASAHKSIGGALMAIEPMQYGGAANLLIESLIAGRALGEDDARGILLGDGMAEQLHLSLGKKMVYTTTDLHGELVSSMVRVVGIFHTGVEMLDQSMGLLSMDGVRQTLGYGDRAVSILSIYLEDQRRAAEIRDDVAALWQQLDREMVEVLTWKESQPDLFTVIMMDKSMNYISQLLLGLLIAAGVFNTMLMGVLERRHEFGVMMALGIAPWELSRLVMIESLWLAMLGLGLGGLFSVPWYLYLRDVGLDFTASLGDGMSYGGVLIDPIIRVRLFPESVVMIALAVMVLVMLATLYPAWKAGRTPPVESLK